jgi:hypothetical protein
MSKVIELGAKAEETVKALLAETGASGGFIVLYDEKSDSYGMACLCPNIQISLMFTIIVTAAVEAKDIFVKQTQPSTKKH